MNCLQSRRLLLAAPREQSADHRAHISTCESCALLAYRLTHLERDIEEAALVPVPEALAERILLPRRKPTRWWFAAAAGLLIVSVVVALLVDDDVEAPGFRLTQAVGPTHPAVVAITEVTTERTEIDKEAPISDEMMQGLKRLGLTLKLGAASAHYVGKCRIEGAAECEHIMLSAPGGYANVMLVSGYPHMARVLVSDRRMVALVGPAGKGVYIVVADTPKIAKRVERLLVRG